MEKRVVKEEAAAARVRECEEARQAQACAAEAEHARQAADKIEQLIMQIRKHGVCARCGYDGAGDERYRRSLSIWEGKCRHGFWPPAPSQHSYASSHACSCSDHHTVMHSSYSRLRCTQCGWEVPNFLKPEAGPQPAVPHSTQLSVSAVHVAPLLAVGYPEPPLFTDAYGRRRPDMRSSSWASRPAVHVQLRVFRVATAAVCVV